MAKDPGSTRIPRFDSVSRIPQPGNIRLSSVAPSVGVRPTKNSQLIRPTSAFLAPRSGCASGLRPPRIVNSNLLKKSSSGDRINNAVNMVSKKTSNAFKKFFNKPAIDKTARPATPTRTSSHLSTRKGQSEKSSVSDRTHKDTLPIGVQPKTPSNTQMISSTPRTFTRSDTFIRESGERVDVLDVTHIIQSTPMSIPVSKTSKTVNQVLATTYSLESGNSPIPHKGKFATSDDFKDENCAPTLDRTHAIKTGFGRTIEFDSPLASSSVGSDTLGTTRTLTDSTTATTNISPSRTSQLPPSQNSFNPEAISQQDKCSDKQTLFDVTVDAVKDKTFTDNFPVTFKTSGEDLPMIHDISMPPECETDLAVRLNAAKFSENLDNTLKGVTPNKTAMTLMLNGSNNNNNNRLLDLTVNSPLIGSKRDCMDSSIMFAPSTNTSQLLYMTHMSTNNASSPDYIAHTNESNIQCNDNRNHYHDAAKPPLFLKGAQSELLLPTRTPDDEPMSEPMEVDTILTSASARTEEFYRLQNYQQNKQHHHNQHQQHLVSGGTTVSLQELNSVTGGGGKPKSRFSFGLDLTDCTLDCSIELCDISLSSTVLSQPGLIANSMIGTNMTHSPTSQQQNQSQLVLKKQNSFELDDSLGILTPDQMKEFPDSTTNTTNTNNCLELPLDDVNCNKSNNNSHYQKMSFHAMRFDQTPSPEDLPLDPIEVKTDITEVILAQQQRQQATSLTQQQVRQQHLQSCSASTEPISVSFDAELPKTDPMTKSSASKISNSFITSVTSVTSLDTGYQGDGEMSRPASRGPGDHSPSNGPAQRQCHVSRQPSFNQQQVHAAPPIRRQDPMTDSDFFTESDADDINQRGDRRAQVIDGQLYGPMLQPGSASVFISEDPQIEDSCMESSGIFTDVENRCDDDLALMRRQDTQDVDISPDGDSTDTVKSNRRDGRQKDEDHEKIEEESHGQGQQTQHQVQPQNQHHQQLTDSQTSSTMQNSSYSNDRLSITAETVTTLSNRTSYCSVDDGGAHVDGKSFSSLEEAFSHSQESSQSFGAGKSTTSATIINNRPLLSGPAVSRVNSTRKHSSLTSLCTIKGVHSTSATTITANANTGKRQTTFASRSPSKVVNTANNGEKCAKSSSASRTPPQGVSKTSPASPRTAGSSVSPTSARGSPNYRKTATPNKWDAVMNKIASNKLLIKKNYNDVKSKVLTGVGGGGAATPSACYPSRNLNATVANNSGRANANVTKVITSKSSDNNSPTDTGSGIQSLQGKNRFFKGSNANRACSSYSKDCQKSSESDLSLSSGSQKLLAKTPLRAAKKRDVRNLSISPTDLGPPPKTQQTVNGASTRPKPANVTLTQKRSLQTVCAVVSGASSQSTSPTRACNDKCLPSNKKFPLLGTNRLNVRNKTPPSPIKNPLKDHNRLTPPAQQHQQHQQQQPIFTAATPRATAALIKRNCITPNVSNGNGNRNIGNSNSNNSNSGNNNKSNNGIIDGNRSRRSWGSRPPTPTADHQQENANCLPVQKQQQQEQQKQQHNEEKFKEKPQQQQVVDKKNSNNNGVTTTPPSSPPPPIKTTTASATPTRSGSNKSLTSSPILNQQNAGKCKRSDVTAKAPTTKATTPITTTTTTRTASTALGVAATIHAATTLDKRNSEIRSIADDSPHNYHQLIPQRSVEEGITWEPLRITEVANFKYLNRHSINGCLDYDSLERFLQRTTDTQQKQNKGFEAMGALLQYLIFDLDAFSCRRVKYERAKANESLNRTLRQLDDAKSVCSELQDQLCEKEAYYMQREEELQALHRCELEKVQQNLSNIQLRADEQISSLKTEFSLREAEEKRSFENYRLEMESKLAEAQSQLLEAKQNEKILLDRVTELENNLQNLDDKLKMSEENAAIRLQAATEREQELLEKLKTLNKELDTLRESKASNERELRDKLNLSQEEVSVLRTSSRRSLNSDSLGVSGSPRNSSSASAAAAALEITRLQSEAESLRCVLELKQKEISKLNKQNEELMRDADERTALQAKISLLEARNEMLQSELEIKSEKEKDFLRQIDEIQKAFNHETVKRTRISYDNEALQWQLKQRSEQLHLVEAKLQELSSQDLQISHNSSIGSLNRSHNGTSLLSMHPDDDISPPASPIIKAIIEKADSVSWVLEMDDETPEVAASKMVKRAGSFRSVERSPSTRRQLSLSANAAVPTSQGSCNSSISGVSGPNPLSQSMSAASVIRQHSNETADSLGRINSRTRSKSVSVKSPEPTTTKSNKKLSRQSSIGNSRKHELAPPATWKEPIHSSSPYAGVRPRSSTLKSPDQEDCYYRASSMRKLITCDSSALNTGERLDIRGLPTHPSIQDLKSQKKNQQIQESAGEAMVSGTNSEDEACSHSSDEVVSTSTASISSAASATSGSSLSLNRMKNHHQHMSLEEEVLLLDKINSLNGTPMEVSWSDEADVFATNGASSI